MFFVSDVIEKAPDCYKSKLQEMTYKALEKLQISFQRVDTYEAISMDDCIEINKKLDMKMVKTLFLCNDHLSAHKVLAVHDLLEAMCGHIIQQGSITGKYNRSLKL